ncbi:MAG: LptF/LptG family permease [Dysgonamonadaceae bacterium]|jgi:lipopolysaccharide export system permease protein|nr:LptF/LptG family permease [Dysgonamonadaceae bacterium]
MIRIRRLYIFVLETFLPLLLATFSVCLFILLMQFLWFYVNDMVGKGVSMGILAELFFYASLSFTPMALPLAVLLASLMTFGNLGEHLELLAMKASGISLLRIMKPLIYFVVVIAGVSFVFQNNIVPKAQTKMYTIVLSIKQKSPELDIPEGIFYKEITGYNVYVRHKDKKGGMLRDLMIYDYSKGFENAAVIVADSGKLKVSTDKKYLILTLYTGESFENLGTRRSRSVNEKIPYRRETFGLREILIAFDTNFTMEDESIMGSRDLGKNMNELSAYIDSVKQRQDSTNLKNVNLFKKNIYTNTFYQQLPVGSRQPAVGKDSLSANGFETYFNKLNIDNKIHYLQQAKDKAGQIQSDYTFSMYQQSDAKKQLLSHSIQLYKKFTLALSCILFFFIGAPLGAIIRKGGLGMPTVLSVVIYLFYYTIETFGTKMAKQEVWLVWEGAGLSSVILAALGIFFTYKSVNDSTMLNMDAWKVFYQKLTGKREIRNYLKKEVIMTPSNYSKDIREMEKWNKQCEDYLLEYKRFPFYISFWKKRFVDSKLDGLIESLENTIEDLLNSEENLIIGRLMDFPIIKPFHLKFMNKPGVRWFCGIIFPIGLIIYGIVIHKQKQIRDDLAISQKVNDQIISELIRANYKR